MPGISDLTPVQAETLAPGIAGRDVLARANTGSGKTLAFLLVAIERIVKHGGPDATGAFPVVVLTPVTDLAVQIFNVAETLLAYHRPMKADLVIGGTDEARDIRRLSGKARIDVLVATPGRFKSLLTSSEAIRDRLGRCQTFVIDEADKLTDPGFLRDTQRIHGAAKNSSMQTLMFSATMDKTAIMRTGLLRADAHVVDVLSHDKSVVNTAVTQIAVVSHPDEFLDVVAAIVHDQRLAHDKKKQRQRGGGLAGHGLSAASLRALREWESASLSGFRVMCFLPSNAFIDYFAARFQACMPDVTSFVLHGGLAQNKRTKVSDAFRSNDDCVLFTSDASARGVDYPDVTCIVQIGFDSRAEYLQRVGRTGRAGKSGTAFVIVAPQETVAVEQVCDVLTHVYATDRRTELCGRPARALEVSGTELRPDSKVAKRAYSGWLGSLASKWKRLRMPKADVLEFAQHMASAMDLGVQDEAKLRDKLHL